MNENLQFNLLFSRRRANNAEEEGTGKKVETSPSAGARAEKLNYKNVHG
jgi:hypothetical protein